MTKDDHGITVAMLCGNSHRATPLCWYFCLFLKIGCRQCKVVGRVLKQTAKDILCLPKEKSGRQCSLLLESNTRLQGQEPWQIHYSQPLIGRWKLSVEGNLHVQDAM